MPAIDPNVSRIKMVANTKHGFENIVWYNFIKYNKKPDQFIILNMLGRFQQSIYFKHTQVIQFYDNQTKQLIAEQKL
ncbi:hypothetical protein FLCU109888_11460 [Flavobacterium cucumis]|uniref:Uncharacterized protein n=1 Tax=Flavobacterium cucumis TaxID=416016 RepID=A0A1M7ZVG3_9FLAO|nr:hypothetical protein SAMN05443547_1212 [Flavobacterium cucumis]